MPSKESPSEWKPRRDRLLKRGTAGFKGFEEKDKGYLWAAVKMGGFPSIPEWHLDDKEEFKDAVDEILSNFPIVLMLNGPDKPTGLLVALLNGTDMEPHVEWFPWATPRQRLEGWVNFLDQARRGGTGIIKSELKDKNFYDHVAKYRVIRMVGFRNFHPDPLNQIYYYEMRTL